MAFDAGSITARLELSIGGWEKAVDRVQRDQVTLANSAKQIGEKFQSLGKTFTVAGGLLVATIGTMITKTANAGDAFWDLSQKTGISVETLSSFKLAADTSGTSIEGFATGMKGLSLAIADATTGGGDAKAAFDALGVSCVDADGKARPLDQLFLDLAGKFANMEDGATKNTLAVTLFGKAGMDLIPMLNLGKQGLKDLTDRARELGITFTADAAKKCDEFNDSLDILKASVGASFRGIALELIPAVQGFADKAATAIGKIIEWAKEHPGLTDAIGKLTLGLLAVGTALAVTGPVLMGIGALIKNIAAIKALALKSIVFTFSLAGTAIVAAGVAKMIQDFKDLREEGATTAEAIRTMFLNLNPFKGLSREGLGDFLADMDDAKGGTINLQGAVSLLDTAFRAIKGAIEEGAAKPVRALGTGIGNLASTIGDVLLPAVDAAHLKLENMARTIELLVVPKTASLENLIKDFTPALQGVDWPALPEGAEPAVVRTEGFFSGLYNDIAQGFGNCIASWGKDLLDFKSLFENIWEMVKQTFFTKIGEMATKWLLDFITPAKEGVKGLAKSVEGIPDALGGVGASAGKMAGSFLSAASSIANIVTAVASVINLFKGPQKQTDVTYWLKLQWELLQNSYNFYIGELTWRLNSIRDNIDLAMKPTLWSINEKAKTANDWLKKISTGLSDLVKKIQPAASGWEGRVSHPTLFLAHPNEEVSIRPIVPGGGVQMIPGGPAGARGGVYSARQEPVRVFIRPVVIDKRDHYLIEFVQENLDHLGLRVPAEAVRGR